MNFVLVLIGSIAACFVLRNPIKKYPMLFYALAAVLSVLYLAAVYTNAIPRQVWSILFLLMQRATLSLALFVVVMFIGVFPKDSKVSQWLRPIRAELSIIAWILCLDHVVYYLESYFPRFAAGGLFNANIWASFLFAVVLFALLIVLGVTSFNVVKRHMHTETWKKVQKLAYPFFILVYVHLMLLLMPGAMRGAIAATQTMVVYSVIFISYIGLRLWRYAADRRAATQGASHTDALPDMEDSEIISA